MTISNTVRCWPWSSPVAYRRVFVAVVGAGLQVLGDALSATWFALSRTITDPASWPSKRAASS